MIWSKSAVLLLRELWNEGHTTAAIGAQLGCPKNAVIGKAHRIGLPGRPSPIEKLRPFSPEELTKVRELKHAGETNEKVARILGRRQADVGKTVAAVGAAHNARRPINGQTLPPLSSVVAMPRPRAAMPRNEVQGFYGKCCWPIDQPPGTRPRYLYCDDVVTIKGPYCNKHRKIAYRPFPDRRKEAA